MELKREQIQSTYDTGGRDRPAYLAANRMRYVRRNSSRKLYRLIAGEVENQKLKSNRPTKDVAEENFGFSYFLSLERFFGRWFTFGTFAKGLEDEVGARGPVVYQRALTFTY